MSDLIKREDAINSIFKRKKTVPTIKQDVLAYCDGLFDAIEIVQDLPSADRWIPCSERLPSENGDYLVTLENDVVKILGYSTTQRTTYPKGFYYIKEGFSWRQVQNPVIAWMPLSKPWKGADDE